MARPLMGATAITDQYDAFIDVNWATRQGKQHDIYVQLMRDGRVFILPKEQCISLLETGETTFTGTAMDRSHHTSREKRNSERNNVTQDAMNDDLATGKETGNRGLCNAVYESRRKPKQLCEHHDFPARPMLRRRCATEHVECYHSSCRLGILGCEASHKVLEEPELHLSKAEQEHTIEKFDSEGSAASPHSNGEGVLDQFGKLAHHAPELQTSTLCADAHVCGLRTTPAERCFLLGLLGSNSQQYEKEVLGHGCTECCVCR